MPLTERQLIAQRPAMMHEARRYRVPSLQPADLVQNALARAWERRSYYNDQFPLRPWLLTILRHEAASAYRKPRADTVSITSAMLDTRLSYPAPSPQWVKACLLVRIPPLDVALLVAVSEGVTTSGLSACFGLTDAGVRSRVYRARARAKAALEEIEREEASTV